MKLTVLVFLGIFILNYELYPLVSANSNYTLSLDRGSQIFQVIYYDEEAWKNNINVSSNPTYWFGDKSDTIGAKSKITYLGKGYGGGGTLGTFIGLFFSWFDISTSILEQYGYNDLYISGYYPNYYNKWYPTLTSWSFGTEPFDNHSNNKIHYISHFLFQETLDFQTILYDYNDFAAVVNNNTALQAINFSMPILSGDDFLWYFILNRYVLVNQIDNYLTEVINILNCKNVSVHENKITFSRFGEKAYITEFAYNSQGLLNTVVVKNYVDDSVIYKITSYNLKYAVYIIIGISLGAIIGLVGFSFYRKRRRETFLLKSIKELK